MKSAMESHSTVICNKIAQEIAEEITGVNIFCVVLKVSSISNLKQKL
jgi:hypothetical protein